MSIIMEDKYRLCFHLMPPLGWLNDPNGLCFYKGRYHVFFQYSPDSPRGKSRYWGHYSSEDLTSWQYEGIAIKSDIEWDRDGAYSGCAFTDDGKLELFYTGNVKEKGDCYDYIHSGRKSSVLTVKSEDGVLFGGKKLLLTNKDYPSYYTAHVRDPRVWKNDGFYYMILGGRRENDEGAVLQFCSADKVHWKFAGELRADNEFGYMWECPDVFELGGKTVFMCCPQGLKRGEYEFQNIYQSGYFLLENKKKEKLSGTCREETFVEWDKGFDFYAPQTFTATDGRRLLIGWAGLPDIESEYNNNSTISEGWQHALTVIRELTLKGEKILQYPIKELEALRFEEEVWQGLKKNIHSAAFDLEVEFDKAALEKSIKLSEDVELSWLEGIFLLKFLNDSGCGRTIRRAKIDKLNSIRLLKDTSMLEIFINNGETVFTTRYYPKKINYTFIKVAGSDTIRSWKLKTMEVRTDNAKE